uniref:Scarecrow-like protein 21 n=1 Tax=Populus alba TaxID=43335 RepID=A0A4U5PY39_POPAL|nr:scarecrow-like protein 21 [Populus alba]
MESQQYFGYGVTGAGLPYSSSYPSVPSIPNRLFGSLKFDRGNSPSSPFYTQFDCDTYTATLSDSQECYSSTDNLSGVSPSRNSSLESNSYFNRPSPSVDCRLESLQLFSGGTSSLEDASSSQNMKHALQELETALMGPDDDEDLNTSNASLGESSRPQTSDQKHTAWRQGSHCCVWTHGLLMAPKMAAMMASKMAANGGAKVVAYN